MSRSNYSDDYEFEDWQLIMWRGAVTSAIKGKRGQAALKELLIALDAMPVKELIQHALMEDGQYCTLGLLGHARGLDERMAETDADEPCEVSGLLNLSEAFVREVAYVNDECAFNNMSETPGERWTRMRTWVASQILLVKGA